MLSAAATRRRAKKISITLHCLTKTLSGVIGILVLVWIYIIFALSDTDEKIQNQDYYFSTQQRVDENLTNANTSSTTIASTSNQSAKEAVPSVNRNKFGISPVKIKLPTPVIVVGFPKSGTTSVWHYFNCSGVISQHFCCCGDLSDHPPCSHRGKTMSECILMNMRANRTMLKGCGNYDVYAQIDGERYTKTLKKRVVELPLENGTSEIVDNNWMRPFGYEMRQFLPQHFSLNELHRDYPNATFILPLRDSAEWATSVINWFHMRARFINEYIAHNLSIPRPGQVGSPSFLSKYYEEHTVYIRDFVKQHPSHALVEFNIRQEDAGEILSKSFGLPDTCWDHKNKMGNRANFDYPDKSL